MSASRSNDTELHRLNKLFISIVLLIFSVHVIGQPMICDTAFEEEIKHTDEVIIMGKLDGVHAFRMFLCISDSEVKGMYEMLSTARSTDLEGFIKGDSILLAEYSPTHQVLGTIRALLSGDTWSAMLLSPNHKKQGTMTGVRTTNWSRASAQVLKKDVTFASGNRIVHYSGKDVDLLMSYPNEFSSRGLIATPRLQSPVIFTSKKPSDIPLTIHSKVLTTEGLSATFNIATQAEELVLDFSDGGSTKLTPKGLLPIEMKELSDRRFSYVIHYPVTQHEKANEEIERIVRKIRLQFDSIKLDVRKMHAHDDIYVTNKLVAWFEPTLYNNNWLCGHFIIDGIDQNMSKTMAFNYSFILKKNIDIDLLVKNPSKEKAFTWDSLALPDMNEVALVNEADVRFSNPALTYRGIILTTPFDRIFDRQLHFSALKNKKIQWKWWKPAYWTLLLFKG